MICSKCKRDLSEQSFNWANRKAGKRQTICRECFSDYNRKRYQENKDRIRKNIETYRAENPTKVLASRIKTCVRNPTHYNANKVVEQAIIAGKLDRPDRCSICGCSSSEHRIEAHHEDYSRPLDVIWCCTPCHRALDMERRKGENLKPTGSQVETIMMALDGTEIKRFPSRKSAAEYVGRSVKMIYRAIKLHSVCAGYRWK